MSKAILVMDMPQGCESCELKIWNSYYEYYECGGINAQNDFSPVINRNAKERHIECPLREIPQKKDTTSIHPELHEVDVRLGYNKCIDEILGKDDE